MSEGQHRQFELLVADAQRQFEENGKVQNLSFWSFKVMCRSFLPSYQNPPLFASKGGGSTSPGGAKATNFIDSGAGYVDYCSWHRYSDFEWLLSQLQHEYPGEIFPPLPPKENDATKDKVQDLVAGTATDNPKLVPFVQARIRWLNMHFQVLMEMPHVHESAHVRAFLAMEESAWFQYRSTVDAERHGTGVEKVAGKLSRFFGKVTNKPVVVYDATSEFGRIQEAQDRLATHMKMCQFRLRDVEMLALHQKKAVTTLEDNYAFVNGGKPLPSTLAWYGHFVAHGDKKRGVVRHVDEDNFAYVQWTSLDGSGNAVPQGDGKHERVPVAELTYPPNGLSDPVLFSAVEAVSQLESFFAYIQHRSETRDLEKLIDLVAFWRYYSESIGATIKRMADIEQKRSNLAADAAKISDVTKRSAKQEEIDRLHSQFTAAERAFKTGYATLFRPLQRKGLFNINLLVGKICYNLLNDDDWPNRLARCDHVLNPNFDVPDEVTRMLEELANGAPPPGAASPGPTSAAAAAVPSSSSSSPQQQKVAAQRASSTAVTDGVASPARSQQQAPVMSTRKAAETSSSSDDEGDTDGPAKASASSPPRRHADPESSSPTAPSPSVSSSKKQTKHDMFADASDDE